MKYSITFLLSIFLFCQSYNIQYLLDFSSRNRLIKKNKVIVDKNLDNTEKSLIFFSGAFSFIRPDIYSNFYSNILKQNISIYTPYFLFDDKKKLTDFIDYNHSSTIVAGHSSGCSTAINFCKNNSKIETLVLLDPVDTFLFDKTIDLYNIKNLLFIIAGKTYNYSPENPSIPFIPFLGYKSLMKKINIYNNSEKKIIYDKNFGHSDILDTSWSNLMHYTKLSVGYNYRNITELYNYHIWLSNILKNAY
jgi:hypothetical protein